MRNSIQWRFADEGIEIWWCVAIVYMSKIVESHFAPLNIGPLTKLVLYIFSMNYLKSFLRLWFFFVGSWSIMNTQLIILDGIFSPASSERLNLDVVFETLNPEGSWGKSILYGRSNSQKINLKIQFIKFSYPVNFSVIFYHFTHICLTHIKCIHSLHLQISISNWFFHWSVNILMYLHFLIHINNYPVI